MQSRRSVAQAAAHSPRVLYAHSYSSSSSSSPLPLSYSYSFCTRYAALHVAVDSASEISGRVMAGGGGRTEFERESGGRHESTRKNVSALPDLTSDLTSRSRTARPEPSSALITTHLSLHFNQSTIRNQNGLHTRRSWCVHVDGGLDELRRKGAQRQEWSRGDVVDDGESRGRELQQPISSSWMGGEDGRGIRLNKAHDALHCLARPPFVITVSKRLPPPPSPTRPPPPPIAPPSPPPMPN